MWRQALIQAVTIGLFGMGYALCIGCASQKSELGDPNQHAALRAFVTGDAFEATGGSIYPTPSECPPDLLALASGSYDAEAAVRCLVAYYFLRYDAALLDRGLVTADVRPCTLLQLLWDKEAGGWVETPSAEQMREHLAGSTQKMGMDGPARELLAINRAKFAATVQRWKDEQEP